MIIECQFPDLNSKFMTLDWASKSSHFMFYMLLYPLLGLMHPYSVCIYVRWLNANDTKNRCESANINNTMHIAANDTSGWDQILDRSWGRMLLSQCAVRKRYSSCFFRCHQSWNDLDLWWWRCWSRGNQLILFSLFFIQIN